MTNVKPHNDDEALDRFLDQASPVPELPMAAIHAAAMAGFPARKPVLDVWAARFGALAATVVLGVGGFMALQSYQSHQKTVMADADAFAEELLSESY
jgi:CHASE2 domain-containing sensor protein